MGGKGRRRGGRRRARQQQEQRPERAPETANVAAGEPVHAASGAEAGDSRAARKRAKRGGGLWGRAGDGGCVTRIPTPGELSRQEVLK